VTSVLHSSVLSSLFSESPREDLTPPRQGRWAKPMGLALAAHVLLIAALTWGVSWNHDISEPAVFEAELWSKLPVEAAPRAVAPPPKPEVPKPAPEVAPPKTEPAPPPPAPTGPTPAEIAVQEAKKKAAEEQRLAELQKAKELKAKELKAAAEKKEAEKLAAAKKAAEDKAKQLKQEKLAKEKLERETKAAEAAAAAAREKQLARMMGQAGATGSAGSQGSAAQSSGPSASYKQKVAAAFKRNIYYANAGAITGNPKAEVHVTLGPTGKVMASKLTRSSGVPTWDESVLRAVDRTTVPPDENGKYPPTIDAEFGPKD
jgi:colicin import membrane protein